MKITQYKDIESFLFKQLPMFQRVGPKAFKKDLKNIQQLDALLDHPHKAFKSIHVAGTNGKGSTSFFLAAALAELGFKVGLYTSPHYKDYRERIKVDAQLISKSYVKRFVNDLIERGVFEGKLKPSFFEITVAMAFSYFKEQRVDFAVIETGLGGRLDSTNIITPVISVITNIGLDHTQFLGNTLSAIAGEKAGIIKAEVPVIIGREQKETKAVFHRIAKQLRAPLTYATNNPQIEQQNLDQLPSYQHENLSTAAATLHRMGMSLTAEQWKRILTKGLTKWGFVGRYQRLSSSPRVIADSAHNEMGIKTLFNELESEAYEQLHIVLAVVADKDLDLVLPYFPKDAVYYFSAAQIPRALAVAKLSAKASQHGLSGQNYTTVPRALAAAKRNAKHEDLILVVGSIFTVAEIV